MSFKPNNYIDYILLSCHYLLNKDFYNKITQRSRSERRDRKCRLPIKILFSEMIFDEKVKFPFQNLLSNYDLIFIRTFLMNNQLRILKLGLLKMDHRFAKSCVDISEHFKHLKIFHAGAVHKTIWF